MAEARSPNIFSIAAHRGFADALVKGLEERYFDEHFGCARLTLILPSSRATRIISEAFVRRYGEIGRQGLLMPRMVGVGDLNLQESLGASLDPLNIGDIPSAIAPDLRWLRLAAITAEEMGSDAPKGAALLRFAREIADVIDRLVAEGLSPLNLLDDKVLGVRADLSAHWQNSLRHFARIYTRWQSELAARGQIDASERRNLLFTNIASEWKQSPPKYPVIAAGVNSASPFMTALLKTIAFMDNGAVILAGLDLRMAEEVWDELGQAGKPTEEGELFGKNDVQTHPQYHLKLLLNRMDIARGEVREWEEGDADLGNMRSTAVSNLFLPPSASQIWATLPDEEREISGLSMAELASPEEEAQAVALMVRGALEHSEERIAVVTPDRALATRIAHHLKRWNIIADDSAGTPLSQSLTGRFALTLAELMGDRDALLPLMRLLTHPLVRSDNMRGEWLKAARKFELEVRVARADPNETSLADIAANSELSEWWREVETALAPINALGDEIELAYALRLLAEIGEAFCGDNLWARDDGRALSAMIAELASHAETAETHIPRSELAAILRDVMDTCAVRPAWGGHPRIAIYGLLEARMNRADLTICAGMNEGVWPGSSSAEHILAPAVLRTLGVTGGEFRIGLAANDLYGAFASKRLILTRSIRDMDGPTIASRFLLRIKAMLGDQLLAGHSEEDYAAMARALDKAPKADPHGRPKPCPSAEQRHQKLSVTGLDKLRADPYAFYASNILRLRELDALDAEMTHRWVGNLAHLVIEKWHKNGGPILEVAMRQMKSAIAKDFAVALRLPRLLKAYVWVAAEVERNPSRKVLAAEISACLEYRGVKLIGKADRIDALEDGSLALVDYKTGAAPAKKQVQAGYAMQLGTLAFLARKGAFPNITGEASRFEYWSLARNKASETNFGKITSPVKDGRNKSEILPENFTDLAQKSLDEVLDRWIFGNEPFTARPNADAATYSTYEQLMRLDEWQGREK